MAMTQPAQYPSNGRIPVYDQAGRVVATIGSARSKWMDWLLGECDVHHVYLIDPDDPWVGCPICEAN